MASRISAGTVEQYQSALERILDCHPGCTPQVCVTVAAMHDTWPVVQSDGVTPARFRPRTPVEGLQVSAENLEEVADWCAGSCLLNAQGDPFTVLVPDRTGRVSHAVVGDWVVGQGRHFWVAPDATFARLFVEVGQ